MKEIKVKIFMPDGTTVELTTISYGTNTDGHLVFDNDIEGRVITNLPFIITIK